jgi:uroporphyrinogen-III decarboxylase
VPGRIPVNVIFSPSWWYHRYGISFEKAFYFDKERRIHDDVLMRRALWERFGLGQPDPEPRPIIGSRHVAGGFVLPALFGVPIQFAPDMAPSPVPQQLSREQALALRPPDLRGTWPMNELLAQMNLLTHEYGHVVGDLNTGGLLNTALELRGQQFFLDLMEDPELSDHLLDVIATTQAQVAEEIRSRTGTCGVAVNRSIVDVDPSIYLHSNCAVQMVSPELFERRLLPYEKRLAGRLRPYGIHHCGTNLHRFAEAYAQTGAVFFDVGWGSDVAACSRLLPDAFLNLRLNPVRLLQCSAEEIRQDVFSLLRPAGRRENVGVCCINMDRDTPDRNVHAMVQAVRDYEKEAVLA